MNEDIITVTPDSEETPKNEKKQGAKESTGTAGKVAVGAAVAGAAVAGAAVANAMQPSEERAEASEEVVEVEPVEEAGGDGRFFGDQAPQAPQAPQGPHAPRDVQEVKPEPDGGEEVREPGEGANTPEPEDVTPVEEVDQVEEVAQLPEPEDDYVAQQPIDTIDVQIDENLDMDAMA